MDSPLDINVALKILNGMKKRPSMWAITKEAFVMQAMLLLSLAGVERPTGPRNDQIFNFYSGQAKENFTEDFAIEFINNCIGTIIREVMVS
jgi:hypothetical protein